MDYWTFAHVSDIHVGTPRSYRFQPAWNENWKTARAQILKMEPEFLIVGGDLTRDGCIHRYELEQARANLDALPFPYRVIPGNHDVGNKYRDGVEASIRASAVGMFAEVFGASEWSFVHRDVRFSGFNALLAGSGLPEEKKMWAWLEAQVEAPRARHHVWVMHPALFVMRPDEANWDPEADRLEWIFGVDEPHRSRMLKVFRETGATLVISSHIHCRRSVEIEGLRFQYSPASAFPQQVPRWTDGDSTLGFLRCEVSESGVEPYFVPLDQTSDKKGYGPGGSPAVEARDYSIAWEKPSLEDMGLDRGV
ncbi:MAG: metallophosphoesterase [bacterium]|nr:metallophosphoesterase [bacterium]